MSFRINRDFLVCSFRKGLIRYDGINIKTYINDNRNPNSIAAKYAVRVYADKDNIVWDRNTGCRPGKIRSFH
jgi:hypothetical protein